MSTKKDKMMSQKSNQIRRVDKSWNFLTAVHSKLFLVTRADLACLSVTPSDNEIPIRLHF